ncbi:MAG: hypothetical protein FOGNACKC_03307 [Anaerolineae bacterium]|nr:hypothetical protein [Anaerolineae bacterium]
MTEADNVAKNPDLNHATAEPLHNETQTLGDTPETQSVVLPGFGPLFVGLTFAVALFLGAAIGYGFGRSQSKPPVQVVVTATPAEVMAQTNSTPAPSAKQSSPPSSASESAAGAPTPTIMDFVLADARHFQGSANAPITMVEFSDFK